MSHKKLFILELFVWFIVVAANCFQAFAGGMNSVQSAVTYGTKFTASGCSNSTTIGSGTAGTFKSGISGTCTVVITLNGGTGISAPTGWSCNHPSDFTTPANSSSWSQTTTTSTTATLSGTAVSGDVIAFSCTGY